jgi:hypothetical protein
MSAEASNDSHIASGNGELVIVPRFTGRSFVAVLRVLVAGESVVAEKIDLAKGRARDAFVQTVTDRLPAVDKDDIETELRKLCDDRARWLQNADEAAVEGGKEPTVADMLVQIAFDEAELCHDKNQNAFATVQVDGHWETSPVRSRGFRLWLRRRLREEHERSAYSDALGTAVEEVEAKALFEAPEAEAQVRLAWHEGAIWLDLADDGWRTVRITSQGWQVVPDKPPVRFIRPRGLLPLPVPERGGGIDELRPFVNVRDDADFVLIVAWLLACLRPRGPFPILSVSGEQGSAKSTLGRLLRALVDPNSAPLRSEPREPRDLVISATNAWVIGLDNLSSIRPWLSDALCRLSTGGGFATRELYSNDSEMIFESQRPVMFNGITDLATRSDLLDRSLLVMLSAIPEDQRRAERILWAAFDKAKPRILGGLLDAVVVGLANEETVKLARVPRMADFALWVTACESGLGWPAGRFIEVYTANRSSANDTAIEASLVGVLVQSFMAGREGWEGTSTQLLSALEEAADEAVRKRREWPKSPRKLSGDLRRIAPNLRAAGIDVDFRRSGKRLIFLGRRAVGLDASGAGPSGVAVSGKSCFENTLQLGLDGLDCMDGREQTAAESDAAFGHDERMAICTIDGGLSEEAAAVVARQQFGNTAGGERNATC